ncbi:hypothetical protein QRX60_44620 [Amycolatopsis mongoliensis]|uniref:Excreted virulence factor EspC (Type VII ESX diderm) n=1 Tax=Amycolatopsis mongoliensis TaxID=715475 RepID=A0A9Y2NGQ4_9PSEU|nr:hypothetical protein [Amycolatopsis sp. 4-36]WIY01049.1 hypothetical protein QRX60_44620 [Amycolatopsis sp. 4-36]
MSSGFEITLEALRTASGAARRASNAVAQVDLGDALAQVGPGLPGGVSGEAARLLADKWGRVVPGWVHNTTGYADQLDASVRLYQADDAAAGQDLRATARHGGRKPV